MGQASITVDIQAKIKGWQDELNKLKSAAAKVDLGSSFGKSLTKEIDSLEQRINSLGRDMTKRLTSESGIETFTDRINNVDLALEHLGQHLSSISFEDIDTRYATEALKNLTTQLNETQKALDIEMGSGFDEAINKSKYLKQALTRLDINPTTTSWKDMEIALKEGISSLTEVINTAKQELVEYNEELRKAEETSKQLNAQPILNVQDLRAAATQIAGNEKDYGFNQSVSESRLRDFIERMKANLEAAGHDIHDETDKINQELSNVANSKTSAELEKNLSAFRQAIVKSKEIKLTDINFGNLSTELRKLITDDTEALDAAKANLQNKLAELKIPKEQIEEMIPKFTDMVKRGNWEEGLTYLANQLEQYKTTIGDKREEIKAEIDKLVDVINQTKSAGAKASLNRNIAQKALDEEYPKIIADLKEKNVELEKRVQELENAVKGEKNSIVANLRNTATGISNESRKQLNANENAAKMYRTELQQVQAREQMLGKIQGVVQRWFSIYAAVRMVSNAIKSVISTVKELDATITEIAIVTKMSQSQLWDQMDSYTTLARQYAASISGVYKVSQLYYQQGLQTADVMALTEQTLKMARISGLDYAQATDYMTNAVRSFKMEMSEAQTVVDVYSAVAAKSATSVTELATAMSKTASSAQSVGSSLQNTTAMMAVMIEATRESPENIGSAMKSIISRYGELKENKTGIDAEGEEYSLNKVDTALQSVGLSIHDVNGEFRDFDEVIMELAEKWDTIDKNTQRYIATVMAGNRQQSRFLALVSSYERLKELSEEALNSEDASQLQFLKTLDSVAAKTQQLQTSLQSLYVDIGLEDLYKGTLDWLNNIATTLNNLPDLFGLPIPAILKIGTTFASLANVVVTVFGLLRSRVAAQMAAITGDSLNKMTSMNANAANIRKQQEASVTEHFKTQSETRVELYHDELTRMQAMQQQMQSGQTVTLAGSNIIRKDGSVRGYSPGEVSKTDTPDNQPKTKGITRGMAITGILTNMAGLIVSSAADQIDEKTQKNRNEKAGLTAVGGILQGAGLGMSIGGVKGAAIGGALGAIKELIEAIGIATESTEEKIKNLQNTIEETSNKKIVSKDELKTLEGYKQKYDELSKSQYSSAEAKQEFIDLQNEIANTYPELISHMDEEGNYVVNLTSSYTKLAEAKREAYKKDLINNAAAELTGLNDIDYILTKIYGQDLTTNTKNWAGTVSANTEKLLKLDTTKEITYDDVKKYFDLSYGGATTAYQVFGEAFNDNAKHNNLTRGGAFLLDGKLVQQLSDTGRDILTRLYMDFIKQAEAGNDLVTAQTNLTAEWGDTYKDIIEGFDAAIYKELKNRYAAPKFQDDLVHNKMSAYTTEYVNLLADTVAEVGGVESSNIQKRFIKEALLSDWDQYFKDNKKQFESADSETQQKMVQDFFKKREEVWYKDQRGEELLQGLGSDIDEFYSNLGKHTKEDIGKLISGTDDLSKKRRERLEEIFDQDYKDILHQYDEWLKSDTIKEYNVQDLSSLFGPEFLGLIQNQINAIISNTSLSTRAREGQIDLLDTIYNVLGDSEKYSFEDRNSILERITGADLTSLTGIYTLTESLANDLNVDASEIIGYLTELGTYINSNIVIEFQTFAETLASQIKDFSTVLSNASKGMDLEKALKVAETLGVTLQDSIFSFRNGNYYITDFNRLKDAYVKQNEQLTSALDARLELLSQLTNTTLVPEEAIDDETGEILVLQRRTSPLNILAELEGEALKEFNEDKVKYIKTHDLGFSEDEIDNALSIYDTYYKAWSEQKDSIGGNASFASYVRNELEKAKDNLEESIEYNDYQINAILIENGKIVEFFQNLGFDESLAQNYADQILNGNFDEIPEAAQGYIGKLWEFVKDSSKGVFDSAINSLSGEGPQLVTVTPNNKALLERITGKALEENSQIFLDLANKDINTLKEEIKNDSYLTNKQKANYYKQLHEIEFPDITGSLEGIITNGEISYSAAAKFVESLGREGEDVADVMAEFGFTFNTLTGQWKAGGLALYNIKRRIQELEQIDPIGNKEEINKLYALLDGAKEQDQRKTNAKAFTDIFSNYEKISTDMVAALATTLGFTYDQVVAWYLTDNGNGTYSLNKDEVLDLLLKGKSRVGEALYNDLLEQVAQFYDEGLASISSASTYTSNGTIKTSDMQKFVSDYNKKLGTEYQISDMFHWNDLLDAYTLKPEYLQGYIEAQRSELVQMGMSKKQIDDYIEHATLETMASAVDLEAFISATNKTTDSLARKNLKAQLDNFTTVIAKREESVNGVWLEAYHQIWDETGVNHTTEDINKRAQEIANANKEFNEKWAKYQGRSSDELIALLEHGGQAAVDFAKLLAEASGEELSSEQIESIYKNKFNTLSQVLNSLEGLEREDIVDITTRDILNKLDGWDVSADGVIKEVGSLVDAYKLIYEEMKHTAGKTTSELNSAYAKVLTQQENADIDAIEALGNAMGMTYDQLGILLGEYGKSLEYVMAHPMQYGLTQIGGGKVQISDFSVFADYMNWDQNSEEYISAFKSYNDSLIAYNSHIKDEIQAEFESLSTVKPGEEINLTRFVSEYGEDTLNNVLKDYGITIINGIAKISDKTNLAAIANKLAQIASSDNYLVANEAQIMVDQLRVKFATDLSSSLTDMIQNYGSISMESIKKLADTTKMDYDTIIAGLHLEDNGNGTYEIDLSQLKRLIDSKREELGEEVYNNLLIEIAQVSDDVISAISNAVSYFTTGTTSQKDMAEITKQYNDYTGKSAEQSDLFTYNNTLKAFTLNNELFTDYLAMQTGELVKLGMSEEDAINYLRSQVLDTVQANIDISAYLSSNARGKGSDARNLLRTQIEQLITVSNGILSDLTADQYIDIIEKGGQAAVDVILKLKGKDATSDELTAALNAGMERINTAIDDVEKGIGEVVTEDTYKILHTIHGYSFTSIGNGQYVINSVGEMVAAYAAIYEQMKNTANSTTRDLNNLYAKYVSASAQKNVDIRDTLSSAYDISIEAFNELLAKYRPDQLLETLLENSSLMDSWGIEQDIFGNIDIVDFNQFARQMRWRADGKEFLEAYSSYVDATIEKADFESGKAIQEHLAEQIKAIGDARPGDNVNVSYLSKLLEQDLPININAILKRYGGSIQDGILKLESNADIAGIIDSIVDIAESTQALIPEEIAELRDTVISLIQSIANLIKKGINGQLSNLEFLDLQNWATNQGIGSLNFTQTADGLQLTADSISKVYSALKSVDALQAQSLLPDIQKTNASFSSFESALQALTTSEDDLIKHNAQVKTSFEALQEATSKAKVKTGVSLFYDERPKVPGENGEIKTVHSQTFGQNNGNGYLLLTPILPDGTELSDDTLLQIADKYLDGEIEIDAKLVGANGKDLEYTLKDICMGLYDTEEAADAAAKAYHNYHEAVMDAKEGTDGLSSSLGSTTELMRDLVTSMLTNPDNFNFMSNKLPDAMQSVVNAYENAHQAIKSLNTASKKGNIGIQDFYNIVTTSSSLMEAAGQEFHVKGMTAAQLMQSACENLVVVDGKLSVDLSGAGMNIVSGIDEMKNNLTTAIHDLAQAEIDMIDAEIKVLEVFAAMEELGDVDVDNDNISFEVEDIFDFNTDTNWTPQFEAYLSNLKKVVELSEESLEAAKSLKLNGISFYDLLSGSWEDWQKAGFTQETLSRFFQTVQNTDWSNFEGDLQQGIAQVLSSLGIPISVDIDGGMWTFSVSQRQFNFRWDDEKTMANAQEAVKNFYKEDLSGDELRTKIEEINRRYNEGWQQDGTNTLDWDSLWKAEVTLAVASGQMNVAENKDGTWTGVYKGQSFTAGSKDAVQELIAKAMAYEDQGYTFEYDSEGDNKVKGTKHISSATIYIDNDAADNKYTTSFDGATFDTEEEAVRHCLEEGYASQEYNGYTYDGGNLEVRYNSNLKVGYTIDHSTGNFIYKGQNFKDEASLLDYIQNVEKLGSKKGWKVHTNKEWKYIYNGDATIGYKLDGTKSYFIADGIEFKSGEDLAAYLSAKEIAENQADGQIITTDNGNKYIYYRLEGMQVALQVLANGEMSYSFTVGDQTFTADSEEGIKQALADYKFLNGGELTGNEGPISYTVTTNGATVTVTYGDDGPTFEGDEGVISSEEQEKLNAAWQEKVKNITPTAEISGLEVTLASGAKATIAGEDTKLPIDEVTLAPTAIKIDSETLAAANLGAQVAEAIQAYLDANPFNIKLILNTSNNPEDGGGGGGSNADTSKFEKLPNVVRDFASAGEKISPKNVKEVADESKEVTAVPLRELSELAENIPSDRIQDISDAITTMQDDKVFAATEAINTVAPTGVKEAVEALVTAVETINSISPDGAIAAASSINSITDPALSGSLALSYTIGAASATGNMRGIARAKGNKALAGGTSTLMGELGPELVVSDGRYFLAGQMGAEFVDLANDAIVFNHLQTARLMKQGAITGRGQPFINERESVSFAKGNSGKAKDKGTQSNGPLNWFQKAFLSALNVPIPTIEDVSATLSPSSWSGILYAGARGNVGGGPALKGARAAIAKLQQIKAMWQSLLGASAKDLAGVGGGGGGGGGGSKEDQAKAMKAFVKELEKWYNWLQRIAVLEEKINYEEARRNKLASDLVPNGEAYYKSQVETLKLTKEKVATDLSLANSQQQHFNKRLLEMNDANNPWSKLYTFDEYGQQKYQPGKLEEFSKMSGRDSLTGEANLTAKEQYEYIINTLGIDAKYMEYDSSGNKIEHDEDGEWYTSAVEAFWDKIDADQQEMQSLHDSIEEHKQAVLEGQAEMNEILHEMQDNQIELENKVLDAVVDSRERNIEEMEKERDAIEQASSNLIDGLSKQLNKEKDMYQQQQDQNELSKLQRQLSILQRSGGSASQIASLQKEISQKQQDAYFEAQQKQIDALQEASDAELERLDQQIELEKEMLEYQKLHGLLWNDVYKVLNTEDPQHIADFINRQNSARWGNSPTADNKQIGEDLFSAQQYVAYAKDMATVTGQNDTLQKVGDVYTLWEEYVSDQAVEETAKDISEKAGESTEEYIPYSEQQAQSTPKPTSAPASSGPDPNAIDHYEYVSNNPYTHTKYAIYGNGRKESVGVEPHQFVGNRVCALCQVQIPTKAYGNAFAKGNTLLGELGPEAWVSNGRFHIAGQAGAEMVDLPNDAIVFNHRQTANLLRTGKAYGRGNAVGGESAAIGDDIRQQYIEQFWERINRERAQLEQLHTSALQHQLEVQEAQLVGDTLATSVDGETIIIENASVNMNVAKLSNDYDAARAGSAALEKMLEIARKTQRSNKIGR